MERRHFLKYLSGGVITTIAGCSVPKGKPTTENPTYTQQKPTKTPTSKINYAIKGVETPESFPLEYSAKIVQGGYISRKSPLQIEISLTNPTEDSYQYMDNRKAFFVGETAESSNLSLYPIVDNDLHENYTYSNTCWSRKTFFGMSEELIIGTLQPGETKTKTVILAAPAETSCPPSQFSIEFTTKIQYNQKPILATQSANTIQPTLTLYKQHDID